MRKNDPGSPMPSLLGALVLSGLLVFACDGCAKNQPSALVETDAPRCPDRVKEWIEAECPGLDALTFDALAAHCDALEEFRR